MKLEKLLVCVGAQKAGTSWLHAMLSHSPDIEFSRFKEIHYFDMRAGISDQLTSRILRLTAQQFGYTPEQFVKQLPVGKKATISLIKKVLHDQWYCAQFKQDRTYCADFTPEYALLDVENLGHIKKIAKATKVIFIMRDPVERSLSAFRYFHQNRGIDTSDKSTKEVMKKLKSRLFTSRSDYPSVIEKLNKTFSPDDVHYLFYENVMRDKEAALRGICAFLDIAPIELPRKALDRKVNTTVPDAFPPEVYQELQDYYARDKRTLAEIFGDVPAEW